MSEVPVVEIVLAETPFVEVGTAVVVAVLETLTAVS